MVELDRARQARTKQKFPGSHFFRLLPAANNAMLLQTWIQTVIFSIQLIHDLTDIRAISMPSQIGGGGEERQSAEPIFDPFLIRGYFWPLPPYCAGGPSVTLQTVSSNVAVPPPLGKPLDNYFTLHLLLPLPLILPAALFPLCVHLLYFYLSSGHHCSSMHWMIGSSTIQTQQCNSSQYVGSIGYIGAGV